MDSWIIKNKTFLRFVAVSHSDSHRECFTKEIKDAYYKKNLFRIVIDIFRMHVIIQVKYATW